MRCSVVISYFVDDHLVFVLSIWLITPICILLFCFSRFKSLMFAFESYSTYIGCILIFPLGLLIPKVLLFWRKHEANYISELYQIWKTLVKAYFDCLPIWFRAIYEFHSCHLWSKIRRRNSPFSYPFLDCKFDSTTDFYPIYQPKTFLFKDLF